MARTVAGVRVGAAALSSSLTIASVPSSARRPANCPAAARAGYPWCGAAVLLWVCAAVTVVLPIAEHEYTYRYVLPAVPLACMAAALAWAHRPAAGDGDGPEPGPPGAPEAPATAG